MTDTPTAPVWYDNHANLYTLAEWIRSNHGWAFCEKNLIDVLEKPWKWEREWRLASGSVQFELIERPRDLHDDPLDPAISTDATSCTWCDAPVGLVAYENEFGPELDWVTIYRDAVSGDFACEDCAGSAANFERANYPLPLITEEMRQHFAAFGHTEIFPVVITRDVQTELGNMLIERNERTWAARNTDPDMSPGSISVWTKHTHYAGCSTSSIPAAHYIRLAGATVTL